MNDIQFKRLVELHIKNRLEKLFENECLKEYKDRYIIQDNKYNISLETEKSVFNIDSINFDEKTFSVKNVNNILLPLNIKKLYVNYNSSIEVKVLENGDVKLINDNDIYLLGIGDIVTTDVSYDKNKIYIIVNVDRVNVRTDTMSDTHNTTTYTLTIMVGSNDYNINEDLYDFYFNEIIRIFNEQSFNIDFKEKNLDIFTVTKPRYKSSVNTENDRIGYIIITLSHFYNNNIRI